MSRTEDLIKAANLVFAMVAMTLAMISCQATLPDQPTVAVKDEPFQTKFLIAKGTEWVYRYTMYEPIEDQPTEIITATYLLTETVVGVAFIEPYQLVHIAQEVRSVNEPIGWDPRSSLQPSEYWYIIGSEKIYQSFQKVDFNDLQSDNVMLAYDLPFTVGKSWCPGTEEIGGQELTDCTAAGERTVTGAGSYEVSSDKFDDCYQIISRWNSGPQVQWYCEGIGVVERKYDHAGTRFGFEQVLIGYESGIP